MNRLAWERRLAPGMSVSSFSSLHSGRLDFSGVLCGLQPGGGISAARQQLVLYRENVLRRFEPSAVQLAAKLRCIPQQLGDLVLGAIGGELDRGRLQLLRFGFEVRHRHTKGFQQSSSFISQGAPSFTWAVFREQEGDFTAERPR